MVSKYLLLFILAVFLATLSQVLLKISANKKYKNKISEYLNIYVISAYFFFFVSTILAIISYRVVPLKEGPIIESIGYIFVLILGSLVLKERVTRNHIIGNAIIIIGIIVFSM